MVFNSLTYLMFLPFVWILFQVTPDRWRWLLLLLASLGFYATLKAPYLPSVLALVATVTYAAGRRLGCTRDGAERRRLFYAGVAANLLILISLKYLPVLWSALVATPAAGVGSLPVTIGISYYVFQAVSYLADVYLGVIEPEQHLGYLFLSLAFFPRLLQGPIERSGDLLPQLKKPYTFDYDAARAGMVIFAWGLFKKTVVADRLALFVNAVYGDLHHYPGLPLVLATYGYAFQIYFDFSGYTDMALGSARLFNVQLTQNFNSPYLAGSVADFWRRWHISFSRWILDYIFTPLQMSWRHRGKVGTSLALMVTFLISGIWHGASWGFVLWGGVHGVYLAASVCYRPWQKKIHRALRVEKTALLRAWQVAVTFNLVCFAWIFFRADSLGDATYVVRHLMDGVGRTGDLLFAHGTTELVVALAMSTVPLLVKIIAVTGKPVGYPWSLPMLVRWPAYCLLVLSLGLFSVDSGRAFIYFQF